MNRPDFAADPNVTGNLHPWQTIATGADYSVFAYPDGVSSPGVVRLQSDPLGQQGKVYRVTVTSDSNSPRGTPNADWAALANPPTRYYGREGHEDWVRFGVMFRSGSYRPTRGEWNWFFESHDDPNFLPWYYAGQISDEIPELALGVANDPGSPKRFLMQIRGGQDSRMGGPRRILSHQALRYNHWYDIVIHEIWSSNPAMGLISWWVDGRLISSRHVADLWQRPDGSYDHVNFEFNNYRLHASWSSTVYYGRTEIGPTYSSIAFPRRGLRTMSIKPSLRIGLDAISAVQRSHH